MCTSTDLNKDLIFDEIKIDEYNFICVDKYIINYPIDNKLMKVISAFGGAGLYKLKSIVLNNIKYNGYEESHIDKMICEHVPFNTELCSKGCKLYINPKMLIM